MRDLLDGEGTPAEHRGPVERWYYDLDHGFHRHLAELYVTEPAYARPYEDRSPGVARYLRDAVHANADRHGAVGC